MRQSPSQETKDKLSRATSLNWKKKDFREKLIKRQRELGYRL